MTENETMFLSRTSRRFNAFHYVALPSLLLIIGLLIGIGVVFLPLGIPIGLLALTVLFLLWVMPELRIVPVSVNSALLVIFTLSSIAIPSYLALVFPGLPYISIRRVITISLTLTFLICVSGSPRLRKSIVDTLKTSPWLAWFFFGYLLIRVLATILSDRPMVSINQDINFILGFYIPFFATIMFAAKKENIGLFCTVLVGGIFIDCILALPEMYIKKPLLMMALPESVKMQMLADNPLLTNLVFGTAATRNGLYRASSIFNTSLSFGEFAAMAAPFALHMVLSGKKHETRIFGALGFFAAIASVVCAGARGGYLCLFISTCCCTSLWTYRWTRTNPHSIVGAILIVIAGLGTCAAAGSIFVVGSVHKIVLGGGEASSSTDSRSEQWLLAKPKILARPLLGYGPGMSADVVGWAPYPGAPLSLDSYVIGTLIDTGVPGLVTYFGTILIAIFTLISIYLRGFTDVGTAANSLASSLLAYAVYRITLNQIENNTLMYQLIALVFVIRYFDVQSRPISPGTGVGRLR